MYCVKCGVKLINAVDACPLCATPVWNPDGNSAQPQFSDERPVSNRNGRRITAGIFTGLCIAGLIAVFTVAVSVKGGFDWAGYALLGIAAGYIALILPLWFKKTLPQVFIPTAHAAGMGYLLYVCLKTHGNWFVSFAMPIALISCVLFTALFVLLTYVRKRQGYILGGFVILAGGFTMLIELFEHITFGHSMFAWSLYSGGACLVLGIFALMCEMIPGLNAFMKRYFFW